MDFIEYRGKQLLAESGLEIPRGIYCETVAEAEKACEDIGPSVVKAQVPIGKRGKAGGVELVSNATEARHAVQRILDLTIGGYPVPGLLVEAQAEITREFYAAVMDDLTAGTPLVLFSADGGMDIEELAASKPESICRIPVDIKQGLRPADVETALAGHDVDEQVEQISAWLVRLYELYIVHDAELVEINPLALRADGRLVALDCKLRLDDAAAFRQQRWMALGADEPRSTLEQKGADLGFKYFELEGEVGLLANGAGLTMTTMDVIRHSGGQPANFLEIGGEAYTKATSAVELVLANSRVKSLVINFCGAFARTDVMTEGVIQAWEALKPDVPVFFSIHGTGEEEAVTLLRDRLSIDPYMRMEDAVIAAVEAAR